MVADLDTLATALYVRVDDLLNSHSERVPWRPRVGIAPKISDAELVTLPVMSALLGHTSEARWLRFARVHLAMMFPYLPQQSGYNTRLRALTATIGWLITRLGRDTSLWTDDVCLADSTPVECGRSRETAKRSDLAGFAEYGYCASHSRRPAPGRPQQSAVIADKNYYGREFEAALPKIGITLLRPAKAKPNARVPDSSNPCARSSNRSTTQQNDTIDAPVKRSLTAYDH